MYRDISKTEQVVQYKLRAYEGHRRWDEYVMSAQAQVRLPVPSRGTEQYKPFEESNYSI
jgi:hypothetical protein